MTDPDPIAEEVARIRKIFDSRLLSLVEERIIPLVERHGERADVRKLYAEALIEWLDHQQAARVLESLVEEQPKDAVVLRLLMNCYAAAAEPDKVKQISDRLLAMQPNRLDAIGPCVDAMERAGQFEEAERMFERLLALPARTLEKAGPIRIPYLRARLLQGRGRTEESTELLQETIRSVDPEDLPDNDRPQYRELLFTLSKQLDRQGDYDGAWAAATAAHEDDGTPFDLDRYEKTMDDLRRVFTPEMAPRFARADAVTSEPLIIMGNPRSGTTLLDTILGMHSEVAQGGELAASRFVQQAIPTVTDSFLPFPMNLVDLRVEDANKLGRIYERQTEGLWDGRRYLSNKALAMHGQIGFLSLALPRMRVINLFRHPLDNCISCYMMNLLVSGHYYTNNLESLGKTWMIRRRMQEFWPDVLEVPVLELHYEDLVSDQENQTRRVLDFLDVPFDDACLSFHEAEGTAATLSYEQVKQKMYTTSKGRWRNYEKHIGPLMEIVEPYI